MFNQCLYTESRVRSLHADVGRFFLCVTRHVTVRSLALDHVKNTFRDLGRGGEGAAEGAKIQSTLS